MDFRFTEAQQAWREEVRAFFHRVMTDDVLVEIRESGDVFSKRLWQDLANAGYLGLCWPKRYHGLERGHWDRMIFIHEACLAGFPAGVLSAMSDLELVGRNILGFGSEVQRATLLPKMVRGEISAAEGLTEPGAGSDLASLETRAERDGDEWILNGSKAFNMAHVASHLLVLARTDPTLPRHRGLTFFLVDLNGPGVLITPLVTMGRWRRNVVYLQDVRVPNDLIIGALNQGFYQWVAPARKAN
ncbi:MAG: acyl-CoA dehydrogenase family protein [Dehalococcoidia bacterium]